MKKFTALFLALVLTFVLCACTPGAKPEPTPAPDPGPDPTPEDKGLSLYELWEKLRGVWICNDNTFDFAQFYTEGPDNGLVEGILASDGVESGTVSDFAYKDGVYSFKMNVPGLEPNDLNDGWDPHSYDITVQLTDDPDVIKLTNAFNGGGKVFEYHKAANSFDELDWNEIWFGPVVDVKEVWDRLAGVWIAKEKGNVYFTTFAVYDDGEYMYYTGAPFSEYGMAYAPEWVRYNKAEDIYTVLMIIKGSEYYLSVDASEAEGATRKLGMNIIAGSGSYGEWIYNCADMADLDPDELFG